MLELSHIGSQELIINFQEFYELVVKGIYRILVTYRKFMLITLTFVI